MMAKKRFIHAINEALAEEMERDERIVLFGEDVIASTSGDTRGLVDRFGPLRVRDTPISEDTLAGMATGAAAAGRRVILHMMFGNFVYTGFDAIANQMAKLRLMTGGQVTLPLTVLAGYGGGRSTAAQHSDTPYSLLMNLGGIKVAVPSTPKDAKGLLKTAIRDDNPTFFLEPGGRGGMSGEVPDGEFTIPFGAAETQREGSDLTIIGIGAMMRPALEAAETLAGEGIEAEIVDLRTLVPMDEAAILASIEKTGRLIVVDEARDRCSAASHIAAIAADKGFAALTAPVKRLTVANMAMPYAPNAEKSILPNAETIAAAARELIGGGSG
jgi:pyruvate dehydrogenase E1 component beta subunit